MPRLRFRFEPTPSPDDPKGADALYRALGMLVIAWGRYEGNFFACLATIRGLAGPEALQQPLPISWKRRATLWSTSFKTLPALFPVRDEALSLMTDTGGHVQERHLISHASWGAFTSQSPTAIYTLSMKPVENDILLSRHEVTLSGLEQALANVNGLNPRLLPIFEFVCSLQPGPPKGEIFWPLPE